MWNKDKETDEPEPRERGIPGDQAPRAGGVREAATIGPSITIEGEVSGNEDLLIQGKVNGSVDLKEHSVTVGREGRVKAAISGRTVTVEGEVDGDLKAEEQVVLRSSARVEGDITAPRVVLEDGARFKGLVDMGEPPAHGGGSGSRSGASAGATSDRSKGSSSGSSSGSSGSGSGGSGSGGGGSGGSGPQASSGSKGSSGPEGKAGAASETGSVKSGT